MKPEKGSCERAILVATCASSADMPTVEVELEELARLLHTAGGTPVARMVQMKDTPDPATYIGSGKLLELAELTEKEGIE